MIRRRTLLAAAGTGLLAACTGGAPDRTLRIATGEPGGFYQAFARLLAGEVSAAAPGVRMAVLASQGSVNNLELLRSGDADLGMVLADTVTAAQRGELGPPVPLRALGRVYENYTQLVVLADSPVRTLDDLAGRTVSIGAPKSGTALIGARLLGSRPGVRTTSLPLEEAIAALETCRIDALLWSGGVPTPAVKALDERVGIRLLPLDAVEPVCRPVCDALPVPPGGYRHAAGVPTIGVANILACTPDLPADLAEAVVRVLVLRAPFLVPRETVGTQFLDVRNLIGTGDVPLHPGAVRAYRALHG
ncbi:C4-dicarboxylate ABC transporter substrate-binding protein [Saccharopolyspora subtropica]|uniref:C4-dicarboxylate ABC transporter substrate-binding protein n=1 Tax=Saccharopolyspora thermophila TaxID=89367 RepID=A0A917N8W1_9PSEU|nr:TAXI family TRAP transporter solute-binding subunit [Saccharopolyspora subtropica]GGI72188.1 C4-dicarboxylate ABC transporter substrate-binding protein [Saccharopolyspora subtropica]